MDRDKNYEIPSPVVNTKEADLLDALTARYNKLIVKRTYLGKDAFYNMLVVMNNIIKGISREIGS